MPLPRPLRLALIALLSILCGLFALVYSLTWHPAAREAVSPVCRAQAPTLVPGQALKVMTWNLQYLAGKRYVFWYDLADGSGKDLRPTAADLAHNLDEVARVLREEQPDLVLLQELHHGAKASDYQDQLALLQERLSDLFPCSSEAFYWKAAFVPHPKILGSVGMKLATLSRYRIDSAERLQLPQVPGNPLRQAFDFKRALLVSHLPLGDGSRLAVINTHLDAFAQGDDTMQRQVAMTVSLLERLQAEGTPWLLGGDFNLLPPGQYQRLPVDQRGWYAKDGELKNLAERYPMIPSLEEASGENQSTWYSHFPNDRRAQGPDRTLDYLFHSPRLTRLDARVRQADTLGISDHLPLLARVLLPPHR